MKKKKLTRPTYCPPNFFPDKKTNNEESIKQRSERVLKLLIEKPDTKSKGAKMRDYSGGYNI